ncbi:uncharacterized protein LOC125660223 [Ostrea edulis]|uniref:uncharacterized protein LOC125660223 n=1 Tax=Ostrea edulis TaxID=37623 RepID=UPI0024AFF9D0|nr:uncharacterized protein LOC125660223 [Ostrea edulis]
MLTRTVIVLFVATLTLSCFCNCLTFPNRHFKSDKNAIIHREMADDLKEEEKHTEHAHEEEKRTEHVHEEEKRTEHAHGIVFFFGDLDRNGELTEVELRRLFSGRVFASHLEDLIRVLMSRDLDKSQSLDVNEWEDIESMSRSELAMMLLSIG